MLSDIRCYDVNTVQDTGFSIKAFLFWNLEGLLIQGFEKLSLEIGFFFQLLKVLTYIENRK